MNLSAVTSQMTVQESVHLATACALVSHDAGVDVGEWVALVCATAAATLGSVDGLLANRPGSWEAALVAQLLHGTVGPDAATLVAYRDPDVAAWYRPQREGV